MVRAEYTDSECELGYNYKGVLTNMQTMRDKTEGAKEVGKVVSFRGIVHSRA